MNDKMIKKVGICAMAFLLGACSTAQPSNNQSTANQTIVGAKWVNAEVQGNLTEDTDVRLQDDFFAASNKDWILSATIKDGKSYEGGLVKYQDTLNDQLKSLINNSEIDTHEEEVVSTLYNQAIDWDSRNEFGLEPIKPYIQKITDIKSIDDLTNYFIEDSAIGYSLTGFITDYSIQDSNSRALYISELSTVYSDPADYQELSSYGKIEEEYSRKVTTYLLQRLGYSKDEATEIYESCIAFEGELAPSNYSTEEQADSDFSSKTIRNEYTLDEIQKIAGDYPIVDIMKNNGFDVSQVYAVYNPRSLKAIGSIYNDEYTEKIKNYLLVHTLLENVKSLDYEAYDYAVTTKNDLQGVSGKTSDEDYALSVVQDYAFDALDTLYTEKYCSLELKQDIESMISKYLEYYEKMLSEVDWLSEETRNNAIEKLKTIKGHASYPEKHNDYSSLKLSDGSYLNTIATINQFKTQQTKDLLKTKKNTEYWVEDEKLGASTINAFYEPSSNDIFICNGLLVSIGYDINWSEEEKLATLGFVIGHELSHAFDPSGAKYDKDGNVNLWWSEDELSTFETKAQKLSDYMSQIKPENGSDEYVNGDKVRNETVADITSLKATLFIAKNQSDFDYEKFFQTYSHMWARVELPSYQIYLMSVDVHALCYLRTNVVVQQFQEFYDTYDVQEGDGMYLSEDDRLNIW